MTTTLVETARLVRSGASTADRFDVGGAHPLPAYIRYGNRLISTLGDHTYEMAEEPVGSAPFPVALVTDSSFPRSLKAHEVAAGDVVFLGERDGADFYGTVLYTDRAEMLVLAFMEGMPNPVALGLTQGVPVVSRRS